MASKLDYIDLINQTFENIQTNIKNLKKINILIAGKSGVGKSTLINAAFRDNLATTGFGEPVTKTISLIEKEGLPVQIYDTVGFELDRKNLKQSEKNIKKLVKQTTRSDDPDDDVHCMWYCVNASSDRFEDEEKNFIDGIIKLGIPVIIVLTKTFSKTSADQLEQYIHERVQLTKACIPVLAQNSESLKAFGIDELVEFTCRILPDSVQISFINAQKGSLALKRRAARRRVVFYVGATFGEGFVPIPLADSAMMMPTQAKMISDITAIYGVDLEKKALETIIPALLGIFGATTGGKTLATSLLKLVPGAGSLVGGGISGAVAGSITTALGNAYIQLMTLVVTNKINIGNMSTDELKTTFQSLLSGYFKSIKAKAASTVPERN